MKCFCKLPGKHHHELWYTLSGFHIVRLPLDSQLGLYILSWEQFWISYFLFSSDFPYAFCISFAYYFSLNAFAFAFWCFLFFSFFLFAHVCMYFWFSYGWPPSMHASYNHSLSKVNKCMCVLVGCYQTQTFKGAKLHLVPNQRLKKIHEENQKREKSPKPTPVKSKKGKNPCVYWFVFSAPVSCAYTCIHTTMSIFVNNRVNASLKPVSFKGFQRCSFS